MGKKVETVPCSMPQFYPQHEVEEFRVLLSFLNDDDGIAFREWWDEEGRERFSEWKAKPYHVDTD